MYCRLLFFFSILSVRIDYAKFNKVVLKYLWLSVFLMAFMSLVLSFGFVQDRVDDVFYFPDTVMRRSEHRIQAIEWINDNLPENSVVIGGFALIDRRTTFAFTSLATITVALSGAYFPISAMGDMMKSIVEYLPITLAMTGLRRILANEEIYSVIIYLIPIMLITVFLCKLSFSLLESYAKKKGRILIY